MSIIYIRKLYKQWFYYEIIIYKESVYLDSHTYKKKMEKKIISKVTTKKVNLLKMKIPRSLVHHFNVKFAGLLYRYHGMNKNYTFGPSK